MLLYEAEAMEPIPIAERRNIHSADELERRLQKLTLDLHKKQNPKSHSYNSMNTKSVRLPLPYTFSSDKARYAWQKNRNEQCSFRRLIDHIDLQKHYHERRLDKEAMLLKTRSAHIMNRTKSNGYQDDTSKLIVANSLMRKQVQHGKSAIDRATNHLSKDPTFITEKPVKFDNSPSNKASFDSTELSEAHSYNSASDENEISDKDNGDYQKEVENYYRQKLEEDNADDDVFVPDDNTDNSLRLLSVVLNSAFDHRPSVQNDNNGKNNSNPVQSSSNDPLTERANEKNSLPSGISTNYRVSKARSQSEYSTSKKSAVEKNKRYNSAYSSRAKNLAKIRRDLQEMQEKRLQVQKKPPSMDLYLKLEKSAFDSVQQKVDNFCQRLKSETNSKKRNIPSLLMY